MYKNYTWNFLEIYGNKGIQIYMGFFFGKFREINV